MIAMVETRTERSGRIEQERRFPGAAARVDLWRRWARAIAHAHTQAGALVLLLRQPIGPEGRADDAPYRRLPAGEIEALVLDQVRALLRLPEVVVGTWCAAQAEAGALISLNLEGLASLARGLSHPKRIAA
jgi:hypothetical protein